MNETISVSNQSVSQTVSANLVLNNNQHVVWSYNTRYHEEYRKRNTTLFPHNSYLSNFAKQFTHFHSYESQ